MVTTFLLSAGDTCEVFTDRGWEPATVVSRSNALEGEAVFYTVRFFDRTQSVWPERRVVRSTSNVPRTENA